MFKVMFVLNVSQLLSGVFNGHFEPIYPGSKLSLVNSQK